MRDRAAEQDEPSEGEQLAWHAWLRHGARIAIDKKTYAREVKQIKDEQIKRAFDRRLAQLASDTRVIIRPKLPQRRRQKKKADAAAV